MIEAAVGLAYSSWGRTSWQLLDERAEEEELAREQRRATEPQLQIAPGANPLLFDEHKSYLRPTRTPEQLQFAVERLRELGFACNEDGLVRSYTRELDELILYADPRIEGRIDFRVFKKGDLVTDATDAPGFSIQDRWVHRLEERLVTAARTKLTTK